MKIKYDVLSLDLLNRIDEEMWDSKINFCWCSSYFAWESQLNSGVMGNVLIKPLSDKLENLVIEEIKSYVPFYKHIKISCNLWLPNSAISCHDDAHTSWAATIYLNEEWNPDLGGWFMWKETGDIWKSISPKRNLMILNHNHQMHCVTPVVHDSPHPRRSLQIWGTELDEFMI
tara:strand:+ start:354 stop:872 length:519 start_codon:yes stop_codon:yes gene_type:complete